MLVIEDQAEIAELIKLHLEDLPGDVTIAPSGREGLKQARSGRHDLIVLDVRLPDANGLDICQTLRVEGVAAPIMVVSAKGTDVDRILGLELGADDYLAKPFNVAELVARAKALLRRTQSPPRGEAPPPAPLRISDIVIDPATRQVTVGSRNVDLTAKEFELLHFLASQPGRVFTRQQILKATWRSPYAGYEHNINCHINRLRLKLERNPQAPRYIVTVWGVGYKFAG
ncbi:MAG: hypothetical protein A3G81_25140 [Betaproteobacteria bacterium RIFCSPLOWO2_12_FULL_65_14]|nr:MAG: hypothetical protein A3G81_25140 [Betaproteobacteria bacterium RIFCSPLOWO2_12_FULL_65_14]